MLVLSRRQNEAIVILGEKTVVVKLLDIRPDGVVRLGIIADRDVPVHRQEVYEAMQLELASVPAEAP